MPVEHALWRIQDIPKRIELSKLENELELEKMIAADLSLLNPEWLLIGRQVPTAFGKFIDLLAIDRAGSVIIIELKRDMTPREVVAQTVDYAYWIKNLESGEIAKIFQNFLLKYGNGSTSFEKAFEEKFKVKPDDNIVNSSHQMVIVASYLDPSTERIVQYLSDLNVAINVVFFRVFQDEAVRYLSRSWFLDPATTQESASSGQGSVPWNGEYYVSFGHGESRNWEDARKYGFISAGGGPWYSRTLNMLKADDRIWVNVPKQGYVGVGKVISTAVTAAEFDLSASSEMWESVAQPHPLAKHYSDAASNNEDAEYFVGVKWLDAVPLSQAKSEVGFFGNQNTVARPTTPKWTQTIERLKQLFQHWDDSKQI